MTEILEMLDREVADSTMGVVLCGDWNNAPGSAMELCLIGEAAQRQGLARRVDFQSAYAHRPPHYTAQDFASGWNTGDPPKGKDGPPPGGWMDVFDFIYHSS